MLNIINYYEQLVTDQLWKLSSESGSLLSQAALEDIACLSLNKLPPCYVRNPIDKGANMTDLHYQEMCEAVSNAISQSLIKVKSRPHDEREK
ncbi:late competence development ComFB family protein [Methylomonas sp. AM2-LC]|uniref:late competence development ComFB family protein n=1 Tax=Methylomonas sp. AM2-LC TaxID=3153301 RepID=UPI003266BB5F